MSRRRSVAVVAGVAVASAAVSWVAATRITDPDDARRSARAPEASLVTVPVELRELSANLVLRGDLSFDEATTINVPAASASAGEAPTRVVTKDPPEVGAEIVEGQAVAEISGRPVIALEGVLPVFRDLVPGSTGDDVAQLEEALARLGHDPGAVDGTFDASTQAALDAMYLDAGYRPRDPSGAQSERIDEARQSVTSAQRSLRDAEKVATEAATPKESDRIQQQNELDGARRAVDRARAAAARARTGAPTEVADAQATVDAAVASRAAADAALAAALVGGATDPETGDPYTPSVIAQLRTAVATAAGEVTAADKALTETRTRTADAIVDADAAVLDAEAALRLAFATVVEGGRQSGADGRSAVDDARASLADALERLSDAEAETDGLPQAEVVFVRSLPRRVGSVSLGRGDIAQGELMTVSGSNLAVRTSVTAADRTLVRAGTAVTIAESDLDLRFEGTVISVADQPRQQEGDGSGSEGNGPPGAGDGGGASSSGRFDVVITPGELPDSVDLPTLEGLNFRVTIPVKSTDGAVLAVPSAALSATGDDQVRVEVLVDGDRRTRFVEVRKGLAAQGFVEVSPVDGELAEGDEVVVGR